MSMSEKTAYLKGLYDGMGLNEDKSKEARMLGAIVDVLQEMAEHVDENEEGISVLDDEVFDLTEAVDNLRNEDEEDNEDEDDEYESIYGVDDDEDEEELELPAEIPCPACGETLTIDADDLAEGEITCPHCGKELQVELEISDEEDDSDDDEIPF